MPSRRVLIALVLLAFALVLALALLDARHDSDPRGAARSSAAELGAQAVETELERGGVAEREIPPASAQTTAPQAAAGGDRARVARLRARCVDEAGRALAGIRCVDVNTQVLRAESARDGRIDVELALSAADETRFAIGLLADFRRPVFADRGVRLGEVWDLGDVVLLPAGRIRGRVVDARALPVSGAWITSTRTSFARWRETYEDDSITAVTGADGVFLLEGAPVGALRVAARAPRHALVAVEPIDVAPGLETGGVEIVLGEALAADDAFDVCVLDPDGRAAPRARVAYHARGASGESRGRRTTDERGCTRFPWTAEDAGWLRASDSEDRFAPAYALRVHGGTRSLELRLSAWIPRALIVVDAENAPVERFAWRLLDEGRYFGHDTGAPAVGKHGLLCDTFAGSSASGEFEPEPERHEAHPGGTVAMNTPDLAFVVQVSAPGFALAEVGPFPRGSAPDTVRVELERLPAVRGRVVAKELPVPGAWVRVLRARGADKTVLVEGFESTVEPEIVVETKTAEDGSFALTLREAGDFVLQAGRDDVGEGELGPVRVDPMRGAEGLVLELVPFGGIEGVVLVARGERASDFVVGGSSGEGRPRSVRPDASGTFRFDNLRPGAWLLLLLPDTLLPDFPRGWEIRDEPALPGDRSSTCAVEPGKITRVTIDLREKVELAAQSDVAPWSEARWDVELTPVGATFSRGATQEGVLLRDVRLRVDAPGDYLLRATTEVARPECSFGLEERLHLAAGENTWTLGGETGAIVFVNRRVDARQLSLRCKTDPRRRAWLAFELPANSEKEIFGLPAGMWMTIVTENGMEREDAGVGVASGGPGRIEWNR